MMMMSSAKCEHMDHLCYYGKRLDCRHANFRAQSSSVVLSSVGSAELSQLARQGLSAQQN